MRKFFRTGSIFFSSTTSINAAKADLERYASGNSEIFFPIPFWRLTRILHESYHGEVALKITNFGDPTLVDGMWMSMDSVSSDDVSSASEYFYILDANSHNEILNIIIESNVVSPLVIGQLGLDDQGILRCYFFVSKMEMVEPGGGTNGASTGIKIPRTTG